MLANKFKFRLNPDVVDDNEYDEDIFYAKVVEGSNGEEYEITWDENENDPIIYTSDVIEYYINEEESWIVVE